MNLSDCRDALSALLDEWLNPALDSARRQEVQREVERIVASCPDGEREWRGLLELGITLRELPMASVPPRVRSNINAALNAPRRPRFWSFKSLAWVGSTSLAALMLWVVARPLSMDQSGFEGAPASPAPAASAPLVLPNKSADASRNEAGSGHTKTGAVHRQPAPGAAKATGKQNRAARPQSAAKSKAHVSSAPPQESEIPSAAQDSSEALPPAIQLPHAASGASRPRIAAPARPHSPARLTPPQNLDVVPSIQPSSKTKTDGDRERFAKSSNIPPLRLGTPKAALSPLARSGAVAAPKSAKLRLRSALPETASGTFAIKTDSNSNWTHGDVTFTVIALPSIQSYSQLPSATGPANGADLAAPAQSGNVAQEARPLADAALAPQTPSKAMERRANPGRAGGAPAAALPQSGSAPGQAVGGFGGGVTTFAPRAPQAVAPIIPPPLAAKAAPFSRAPAAPFALQPNDNAVSAANAPLVFNIPPGTARSFRVTLQAQRFVGPARVRLEGVSTTAATPPLWQGTLAEQTPISFNVETTAARGEPLNLVLEQILPNGESGEYKVFPLVRP